MGSSKVREAYEEMMRIQLCPALMDWIVFLVLFAVLYSAGERGLTGSQCAWLGSITMVTYMATSLLMGMILTRRNARRLLLLSTVLTTMLGAACLVLEDFRMQIVCLGLFGGGLATFFNSFQTFMRGETVPGGLGLTVARYTLAWSAGSSLGFLSSGAVYRMGTMALGAVEVAVGLGILLILLRHRHRNEDEASADEHIEQPAIGARPVNPAYVGAAWCMIFTAAFVQRPLQSLFPAVCGRAGISPAWVGGVLFLHMLVQGVVGYTMYRFGPWHYRRTPIMVFHGAAALLLGLVAWRPTFAVSSAGIVLLGVYMAFAYFSAVYYSSNSGRRSLNIGVNECLVGFGCFAGLFAAEKWTAYTGNDAAMYMVGAVMLLVSMLIQMLVTSRPRAMAEISAIQPMAMAAPGSLGIQPALPGSPIDHVVRYRDNRACLFGPTLEDVPRGE
ncbi:MAG: MFS transporter [Pirellulaceae bacterium]